LFNTILTLLVVVVDPLLRFAHDVKLSFNKLSNVTNKIRMKRVISNFKSGMHQQRIKLFRE